MNKEKNQCVLLQTLTKLTAIRVGVFTAPKKTSHQKKRGGIVFYDNECLITARLEFSKYLRHWLCDQLSGFLLYEP